MKNWKEIKEKGELIETLREGNLSANLLQVSCMHQTNNQVFTSRIRDGLFMLELQCSQTIRLAVIAARMDDFYERKIKRN